MIIKQMPMLQSKYKIKCPYVTDKIGITVHNTANSAPAVNEIKYMINNNEQVSYHVAVDENEVIECIPFDRKYVEVQVKMKVYIIEQKKMQLNI